MTKNRASEKEKIILNVVAPSLPCSYETKEYQLLCIMKRKKTVVPELLLAFC